MIDALYFRDPSYSHGIPTMFLSLPVLYSLPLYLLSSYLFDSISSSSLVPVSLAGRVFDWGQALGFHTIYNAGLSNGIEIE